MLTCGRRDVYGLQLTIRGLAEDNAQLWHDSHDALKNWQHEELEAIQHELENIRLGQETQLASLKDWVRQLDILRSIRLDHDHRRKSILRSLDFPQLTTRESSIAEAHAQTFQWIFGEGKEDVQFVQWLRQPKCSPGVYWIAGKAGCGKSTLMKFLYEHNDTQQALRHWAGKHTLVTARHYFWSGGRAQQAETALQRSQEGLLRTLLFEVLKKNPQIIAVALPVRWKHIGRPWTVPELLCALKTIASCMESSTRFCFFIDGLDEYEGEPLDLLSIIKDLDGLDTFKFCVSSRPWPAFVQSFYAQKEQRIYVEALTRSDIHRYVEDKLQGDPNFVRASKLDQRHRGLADDIVIRASGVFLWVVLVVRSLLRGLTNADSIATLWKRLQQIPTELEAMFEHMLGSIEEVYHRDMARSFLLAIAGTRQLPLLTYYFADNLEVSPRRWPGFDGFPPTSIDDIESSEELIETRIAARCMGLLEVPRYRLMDSWEMPATTQLGLTAVDFLHRTVAEWLQSDSTLKKLQQEAGDDFQVYHTLTYSLAMVMLIPTRNPAFVDQKNQEELLKILQHCTRPGLCDGQWAQAMGHDCDSWLRYMGADRL
jgi:hypothetical protein